MALLIIPLPGEPPIDMGMLWVLGAIPRGMDIRMADGPPNTGDL